MRCLRAQVHSYSRNGIKVGTIVPTHTYIAKLYAGAYAPVLFVPILLYMRLQLEVWVRNPPSVAAVSQKIRSEKQKSANAWADVVRTRHLIGFPSDIHGRYVYKNTTCYVVAQIDVSMWKIP